MALETVSEPLQRGGKVPPRLPGTQVVHDGAIDNASARAHERRRHLRSRIVGPHAVTVLINEKNAAVLANLSEGGMRVQALGRRLEPAAKLRLQFQLPGLPERIQASGVVAWVGASAEAGIRFADLPESLAHRLRKWLAKNEVLNAAREFMKVAGGWQAALDLMAELTRMLTGVRNVAITLATRPKRQAHSSPEGPPPMRATVAAPIYDNERIVGHLEIASAELGTFDEQDLSLLQVLAAIGSEMTELRAPKLPQPVQQPSPPPASIARRIEGMFPTIRVRLVP